MVMPRPALSANSSKFSGMSNVSDLHLSVVDTTNAFQDATSSTIPTPTSFEPLCQAVDSLLQSENRSDLIPADQAMADVSTIPYFETMSSDMGSWDIGLFDDIQGFNTNVRCLHMLKLNSSKFTVIEPFPRK
jgi:hypothetical protein